MNNEELQQELNERKEYWLTQIDTMTRDEIAGNWARLEQQATHDQLTGLINENEFDKQFPLFCDRALKQGSQVFIVYFDFDDLKKYNDEQSHAKGDELLKRGVNLLRSALRSSDLLARLHGDEFGGALEFTNSSIGEEGAEKTLQRVVNNLAESNVSISLGLHEYKEGDDLKEIKEKAEQKMKIDKATRNAGRSKKQNG